ncbi:sugar transferase [Erysipelothrix rhusiopathiae]|nr:sugar transferase [Erysipelothrix rhusiopathiae]
MLRKNTENLVMFFDFVSLIISYVICSYLYLVIYVGNLSFYNEFNKQTCLLFILGFLFSNLIWYKKNRRISERTILEEINNVLINTLVIGIFVIVVVFVSKISDEVSRVSFALTLGLFIFIAYLNRLILRQIVYYSPDRDKKHILIVSNLEDAKSFNSQKFFQNQIKSTVLMFSLNDANLVGEKINGVEIVCCKDTLIDFACKEVVDDVLFHLPYSQIMDEKNTVKKLQDMGIIVNINLDVFTDFSSYKKNIEYIGDYPVISFYETSQSDGQIIIKRIVDVFGSLIGSVFTLVIAIFLGPIIKLESPGPIFFKQKRVGKNGRLFYIYKFRSMGVNAEQQKVDLLSENEVDGLMFKMSNDPRVTKVGAFIRATSIDELPQFFNVLKGDMSLVGTRPPTVDEFVQYSPHHKKRLSMKPGITGLWQVSGRSDIKDFEEVVRLDVRYINECSIRTDFKIMLKTVYVVFAKVGSK